MGHARRICARSPLLKKGVERGLITTFTIGSMMCKETLKKGFVIKEIVEEAEDSVLPVSKLYCLYRINNLEAVFLETASQIMDHRFDGTAGSA
ncbi:hypothetical protein Peur_048207 [Populus x canadensis]